MFSVCLTTLSTAMAIWCQWQMDKMWVGRIGINILTGENRCTRRETIFISSAKNPTWTHTGSSSGLGSEMIWLFAASDTLILHTYTMTDIKPLNAELNPICHLLVLLGDLTFMGPCIVSIFQYIPKKMQRYTVYLYLETALHVRVELPPELCRVVSRYK
jgi:hypothetical protein